uniref:G_PROTEIN_RECEP_F1_2 domain-containing protein n=1 Tax=Heterorhabditis bacteriophora TaxID=37862 RepID=A0A1I7WJV1_HETBA
MVISKQTYTLSVLATQYAFPLFSLVFAYSRIAHRMKLRFANRNISFPSSLNSSQRRRSVVERQRRTHLLLMCVVAVFAIAWLPLNVFHMNVGLRKLRRLLFGYESEREDKKIVSGKEKYRTHEKTLLTADVDRKVEESIAVHLDTDEQL